MIGRQFVLEFVNAALYASSVVVIAPNVQRRIVAVGDKDSEHIAGQVDKLTTNRRLCRLDLFAHNDKTPRLFPIPEFKLELAHRVVGVNGLPLSDLVKPALEISRQPCHDDIRQSALFQKAEQAVGVETRIGSYSAYTVIGTQQVERFAPDSHHPLTGTAVTAALPSVQNQVSFRHDQ